MAILLSFGAARAETHRIAVVVGSNAGAAERPALRFAEADAGKVARVLVELGGVPPDDMLLLQGRGIAELREAIEAARARSQSWHDQPDARVVLFFYFSGHSDGKAMELRSERLDFQTLRSWITSVGADVRLIVVDTCRSGSLLGSKGGTKGEPFDVQLTDDLPKSGEAVITSSAADEIALESGEIRGSFFTHHFVSGLRGAADASGDGQITLAEAYQYAFSHTTSATADTLAGTQHPSYDFRLSGQGELVGTELAPRPARCGVPAGYQRVLITQLLRDQVVAEVTTRAATRVALAPGAYGLRAWRDDKEFAARVDLAEREERALDPADLAEARPSSGTGKGPAAEERFADGQLGATPGFAVTAAGGRTTGVAQGLGGMTAVRLGLLFSQPSGLALHFDAALGEGGTFSERRGTVSFGYQVGHSWGAFSASAGAEVAVGIVSQHRASGDGASSSLVGLSPSARIAWWFYRHLAFDLEAGLLTGVYRKDAAPSISSWPSAHVGLLAMP